MNLNFQSAAQVLRKAPCDFVGTYELSLYLKCHRKTIERLVARGVLRPIRVGRNFRFSRAQVVEALGVPPEQQ